jgi:mannose-6-phosphate isomerase-like protein (cupin superfamily)
LFFIDHESTQEIEERMVLSGEYYDVIFVTQLTRATALAHIVAVDRVRVEPERHSQTHRHNDAETVLFIESGSGTVVINTIDHFVTAGDRLCIPRGAWHSVITGREALIFTSVQSPPIHDDATGRHDLELETN